MGVGGRQHTMRLLPSEVIGEYCLPAAPQERDRGLYPLPAQGLYGTMPRLRKPGRPPSPSNEGQKALKNAIFQSAPPLSSPRISEQSDFDWRLPPVGESDVMIIKEAQLDLLAQWHLSKQMEESAIEAEMSPTPQPQESRSDDDCLVLDKNHLLS